MFSGNQTTRELGRTHAHTRAGMTVRPMFRRQALVGERSRGPVRRSATMQRLPIVWRRKGCRPRSLVVFVAVVLALPAARHRRRRRSSRSLSADGSPSTSTQPNRTKTAWPGHSWPHGLPHTGWATPRQRPFPPRRNQRSTGPGAAYREHICRAARPAQVPCGRVCAACAACGDPACCRTVDGARSAERHGSRSTWVVSL